MYARSLCVCFVDPVTNIFTKPHSVCIVRVVIELMGYGHTWILKRIRSNYPCKRVHKTQGPIYVWAMRGDAGPSPPLETGLKDCNVVVETG